MLKVDDEYVGPISNRIILFGYHQFPEFPFTMKVNVKTYTLKKNAEEPSRTYCEMKQ